MSAGGPFWLPGARTASGELPDVDLARLRGAQGLVQIFRPLPKASWPFKRRRIDVEMGLFDEVEQ